MKPSCSTRVQMMVPGTFFSLNPMYTVDRSTYYIIGSAGSGSGSQGLLVKYCSLVGECLQPEWWFKIESSLPPGKK
jgi:hypothetical protein